MGIGKYFHKKKDSQGDSPQQPRRFRSRRGSADLGTSPYSTAETAPQPETGPYPLKGNYSTTAVQNPRTRSRASSIASRFKRPSSYAGPPHGSAPFLPEPQMGSFQSNDFLDGANYPPSPYNSHRQPENTSLERGMNNMALTNRHDQGLSYQTYDQSLPSNSSPQAPPADHVSPTGATMRKIEPETPVRRQPPAYQPQLSTSTSTTTQTVTTSYPRNVPHQYSHQPENRQVLHGNSRTMDASPVFDRRVDGPYPKGNDRSHLSTSNSDGVSDSNERKAQFLKVNDRTQGLNSVNDDTFSRSQRQGLNSATDGFVARKQRQPVEDVSMSSLEGNRGQAMDNGAGSFMERKNSIPRKPIDPRTNPSYPSSRVPQGFPVASNAPISRQQRDYGPRIDNVGTPTAQQVVAGAKTNTYDTLVAEKVAPAVIHETVNKKILHVREEQINKEIHTHDVFHRILPIVDVEVLPTRHFLPVEGGGLVEIGPDEVPGRAKNWVVAETASKIASDQPAPEAVSRFTAREFPGTEGDFERIIAPDGHEQTKTTWVHPPTLETGAQETGQTWPFEFGEKPSTVEGVKSRSSGSSKMHRKVPSKSRTMERPGAAV